MNLLLQQFAAYFQHYGYWTLAAALLLENAGVPVPGETVLIVASVLADSHRTLSLPLIILVGTTAATAGDNLGYALGFWGGRRLLHRYGRLFHLRPDTIHRGERIFQRYGPATIFFARFVFGLRVIAGPLAGALRMQWTRFALFNTLGAAVWVTVIASLGYLFGQHLPWLLRTMRAADVALLVAALLVVVSFGKRLLKRVGQEE